MDSGSWRELTCPSEPLDKTVLPTNRHRPVFPSSSSPSSLQHQLQTASTASRTLLPPAQTMTTNTLTAPGPTTTTLWLLPTTLCRTLPQSSRTLPLLLVLLSMPMPTHSSTPMTQPTTTSDTTPTP